MNETRLRHRLRATALTLAGVCIVAAAALPADAAPLYDTLIRGGTVYDGSGAKPWQALKMQPKQLCGPDSWCPPGVRRRWFIHGSTVPAAAVRVADPTNAPWLESDTSDNGDCDRSESSSARHRSGCRQRHAAHRFSTTRGNSA
jgi:hypothetical protein